VRNDELGLVLVEHPQSSPVGAAYPCDFRKAPLRCFVEVLVVDVSGCNACQSVLDVKSVLQELLGVLEVGNVVRNARYARNVPALIPLGYEITLIPQVAQLKRLNMCLSVQGTSDGVYDIRIIPVHLQSVLTHDLTGSEPKPRQTLAARIGKPPVSVQCVDNNRQIVTDDL
jgi:hypothetical protein